MDNIKIIKRTGHSIKIVLDSTDNSYITDSDAEMDARAKQAVKAAVSKAEFCKKPVAKYDVKTKQAYVEYPDGSRVNV